jgi:hypothetical protein
MVHAGVGQGGQKIKCVFDCPSQTRLVEVARSKLPIRKGQVFAFQIHNNPMKIPIHSKPTLLIASLVLLGSLALAQAGSFITDFNSGLPANSAVFGNTVISTSGGFTNSGCLELTTAVASQSGGFVITNDLDAGTPVVSFTASYKVLIGGGNAADGMSFNFAPDLPLGTITEEGAGTGLTVEFDTFNNGGADTAPSIDVLVGGVEQVTTIFPGLRTGAFVDAVIQLNPNNSLSVIYDGVYVYSNLDLNAYGYVPAAGSLFGFGARTGGSTDNHFVDDLSIVTLTNAQPYVQSFAPSGRQVPTNSTIDIVLTDDVTQVNTNSIVLRFDGTIVSPGIITNGTGDTFIDYAPALSLGSTHAVSLAFADNATPTPNTNILRYRFTVNAPPPILPDFVTVFSDGFETYVSGDAPLDKNFATGNPAPNGSGNPWFGPAPPNARVVGAETGVTPHSGTNMITGSATFDGDENWYNLLYRLRGGQPPAGNLRLDWWFYDPSGPGDSGFRDYIALAFYSTAPANTDYPGSGSLNSGVNGATLQRLSLGAAVNLASGYDSTKYQARVVGGPGYNQGWVNTSLTRSIGWHHARIVAGPTLPNNTATIYFFIDDMTFPLYTQNSTLTSGFNVIEINSGTASTLGYFDDVSFALAVPPKLTTTQSGGSIVISWAGGGFTLQSATDVKGPYTDIAGATSPYTYSGPTQFFRLRN